MKKLIAIILISTLTSCTTITPSVKEYSVTKHYRIIGTKCSNNAYYSHELNKCVRSELVAERMEPSGSRIPENDLPVVGTIQRKRSATKRKAIPVIRRSKKIDCAYILNNINQCSI